MKEVLIISPFPTHPLNAGNRARLYQMVLALKGLGFTASLFLMAMEPYDESAMRQFWEDRISIFHYQPPSGRSPNTIKDRLLRPFSFLKTNSPGSIDYWYDPRMRKPLEQFAAAKRFCAVFVEYVFFSKAFESVRAKLKVIDAIDVFAGRQALYEQAGHSYCWFTAHPEAERKGLERADEIIAIQEEDEKYFSERVRKPSRTIGHLLPPQMNAPGHSDSKTLLFVGSDHPGNWEAVDSFIQGGFRKIRAAIPEAKLRIVGSVCRKLKQAGQGVEMIGRAESLAKIYLNADVVINPVTLGTGLPIKMIEAMAYGKAIVCLEKAARGLGAVAGKAFRTCSDDEDFTLKILKLLGSRQERETLGAAALRYSAEYYQENLRNLEELLRFDGVPSIRMARA